MEKRITISIVDAFEKLPDPRINRRKKHDLVEIIVVALCTIIAGGEGWEDMEDFGRCREEWLRKFLRLENGIPSHDTFRRVFERLDPDKFQKSFVQWHAGLKEALPGEVIAIDGKTLRHAFDTAARQTPIHLVNAWATERGLALAHKEVDSKSNEIKAIPQILEMLALKGCIVTIDAMGCQKSIAAKIQERGADYILAVKSNQKQLYEDIRDFFEGELSASDSEYEIDRHEETEKGHGRLEVRRCFTTGDIAWLGREDDWKGIRSIGMIEAAREINGSTEKEARFYISSLESNARKLAGGARSHWGVENSLHWVLDVTFNEDASRVRRNQAPANLSTLRKIALSLLKAETTRKKSIKRKRKMSVWDDTYMFKILNSPVSLADGS